MDNTFQNIKCNLCGGSNFYKEAGHYYCSECQTQSQEIQEHVFQVPEEVTAAGRSVSKRVKTAKKVEDSLTSWECYNYIIRGLVEEVIELGAKTKLKQVVKHLWFKYLMKLEVLRGEPNAPPKLPAVNSEMDAGVIYGRYRKKRKRSRTPSPSSNTDSSTIDSSLLRREKTKQRRSLILSQYDEFSNTLQSEDVSLHNQSLVSLKTVSDTSSKNREKFLQYNKSAKEELRKLMSKNHLKLHCRDIDSTLDCHKVSHKALSWKYSHGPEVLSRNRIFAIIYLGLLIIKDDIQLADIIRFAREGDLSYHKVNHFFPEEFNQNNLNLKNWNAGNNLLSHNGMRRITAEIAKFIDVTKYVPQQDLIRLCRRYCNELNLPYEVMGYTVNLISKAVPKLQFTESSKFIPNYEGRMMSMIIFILKLFFGLDDVTEDKFSAYAETFNCDLRQQKMFVWNDWIHFLYYRKLVLMQHHFPTKYLYDDDNVQNSELFTGFMTKINSKYEHEQALTREAEVIKRLLEKLKERQGPSPEYLCFTPSLTPFRDYVKVVLNSSVAAEYNYLTEILELDCKYDSLDFLAKPFNFLEELNRTRKVGIKHRGANDNIKLIKIDNIKVKREYWRRNAKKQILVQLCHNIASDSHTDNKLNSTELEESISHLNTKGILKNFTLQNLNYNRRIMNKLLKIHRRERRSQFDNNDSIASSSRFNDNNTQYSETLLNRTADSQTWPFLDRSLKSQKFENERKQSSFFHYNPHERFWLKSFNAAEVGKEEFDEVYKKLPESFRFIVNECARIIEHNYRDLYQEYSDAEVYLCYVAEFTDRDKLRDNICEKNLKRVIQKAKRNW